MLNRERKGREGRREILSFFASFALAKPKLAESPSSEGWASAFNVTFAKLQYR